MKQSCRKHAWKSCISERKSSFNCIDVKCSERESPSRRLHTFRVDHVRNGEGETLPKRILSKQSLWRFPFRPHPTLSHVALLPITAIGREGINGAGKPHPVYSINGIKYEDITPDINAENTAETSTGVLALEDR